MVTVGASHGSSIAVTLAVVIPIMTNTIDVKKGEELLMPIAAKNQAKRKAESWKDEVGKGKGQPRAKPRGKAATESKDGRKVAAMEIDAEIRSPLDRWQCQAAVAARLHPQSQVGPRSCERRGGIRSRGLERVPVRGRRLLLGSSGLEHAPF